MKNYKTVVYDAIIDNIERELNNFQDKSIIVVDQHADLSP